MFKYAPHNIKHPHLMMLYTYWLNTNVINNLFEIICLKTAISLKANYTGEFKNQESI